MSTGVAADWPEDASCATSTWCLVPFDENDLKRFADVALRDVDAFVSSKRPDLVNHRRCVVLAEASADHFVHKTGFRCISVWTFFEPSATCKTFPARRHKRVDFGSDKFGRSSWIKHPCDRGFVGRGINVFGRTIAFAEQGEGGVLAALRRYLTQQKTQSAEKLAAHHVVLLWPPERLGEIVWVPDHAVNDENVQLDKRTQ